MILRVAGLLACVLLLVNACNNVSCACVPTLNVYGASSLAGALEDMQSSHPGFHSNVHLSLSTGSSTALRTQIEQGAPADIFLSADTANPAALMDAGLVDGSIVSFATNSLVIIVPTGNPAAITAPRDLARPGVRIIAAGEGVPITRYAEHVVSNLAGGADDPTGLAAAYAENIVSREDNVGAVVSKIRLGEGDAALVYVTDARSAELETIELPIGINVPATYSGVLIDREDAPSWAGDFLNWLRGSDGQRILAEHGFSPAP